MHKTRFAVGLAIVAVVLTTSCKNEKLPGAWTLVDTQTGDAFYTVNFVDAKTGWLNGQTDRDYEAPDANKNGNQNKNAKPNKSAANNSAGSSSGKKPDDPLKANQGFEVLHTTDGGNTWAPIPDLFKNKIRSVWFADAQTGWALTIDRNILGTTDGGTNWVIQRPAGTVKVKLKGNVRQPEMDQPEQIDRIRFIDKTHGWAWGGGRHDDYVEQPGVLLTTVNGRNWNQVPYPFDKDIVSLFFVDPRNGWISTVEAFYKSTDGGLNWTKIQT
jgi:photosystem II stability/assembly factor-like uncharacterized protein